MFRRFGVVALVCSVALAAGCSSSKRTSTPTTGGASSTSTATAPPGTSSTTNPPSTTTSGPPTRAADQALAAGAVLKLPDLPAGWTGRDHVPNTDKTIDAQLAKCMHVEVTLVDSDLQPHADSQDFSGPGGAQIQSGVAVFPGPALPTQWTALYAMPGAQTCLADTLGTAANVTLHASPISVGSVGDGQVGVRVSDGNVSIDTAFARRGRALAFIVVQIPAGIDEHALLSKMIPRLDGAA